MFPVGGVPWVQTLCFIISFSHCRTVCNIRIIQNWPMMTSSNGNIFRVTGPLCGEFTGPGEFPTQKPVTRSFDVLFDLRLNKRLSKQPWGWWLETPSWSLWRQRNAEDLTQRCTDVRNRVLPVCDRNTDLNTPTVSIWAPIQYKDDILPV